MANYCVMNHQKYSYAKGDNLKGLQDEQNREATYYNDIIYADKTNENVALVYSDDFEGDVFRLCKEYGVAPNDDSVLLIGTVYTMSPEWVNENCDTDENGSYTEASKRLMESYFNDCVEFHKQHYGLVISAHIHYDQTTPHLQVYSVPILQVPTLHNYYVEAEEKTITKAITKKQADSIKKRYEKAKKNLEKVEKLDDEKVEKTKLVDKAKKALKAAEIEMKEAEAGEHTETKLIAKKDANGQQIRISEEGTPEEYKARLKQPKIRKKEQVKDEHGRVITHWALGGNFALGGAADLSKQQTEFAEKVGKKYGLERGVIRVGTDEFRQHRTSKSWQVEQLREQEQDLTQEIATGVKRLLSISADVSDKEAALSSVSEKLNEINTRDEESQRLLRVAVDKKQEADDYAEQRKEQAEAEALDTRDEFNRRAESEYAAFLQRMNDLYREKEKELDAYIAEQKKQIKFDTINVQTELFEFLNKNHCKNKKGDTITWWQAYVEYTATKHNQEIAADASQRKITARRRFGNKDEAEEVLAKFKEENVLSK